jgi:hypothetical protein
MIIIFWFEHIRGTRYGECTYTDGVLAKMAVTRTSLSTSVLRVGLPVAGTLISLRTQARDSSLCSVSSMETVSQDVAICSLLSLDKKKRNTQQQSAGPQFPLSDLLYSLYIAATRQEETFSIFPNPQTKDNTHKINCRIFSTDWISHLLAYSRTGPKAAVKCSL